MPKRILPAWFFAGLLFGISFIVQSLWWCFLPAFILFLYAIGQTQSRIKVFIGGLLTGTMLFGGSIAWWFDAMPIQWIAREHDFLRIGVIGIYFASTSLLMGTTTGLVAYSIKRFGTDNIMLLIVTPLAWVGGEIARSLLFSIFTMGAGGGPDIYFGLGYIGYLLAQKQTLITLAQFGGVYGLSYSAALAAALFYTFFTTHAYKKKRWWVLLSLGVIGIAYSLNSSIHTYKPTGQKVIAIDTYFDRTFNAQPYAHTARGAVLKEAVAHALRENPTVIILPEDSRFSQHFNTAEDVRGWIVSKNPDFKGALIDSGRTEDSETQKTVVRAFIYDMSTTTAVFSFDKQYLVPHGEFLPTAQKYILGTILSKEKVAKIEKSLAYQRGPLHDSLLLPATLPSILFCFESVSPLGVLHAQAARNPEFVAHVLSHAWFEAPDSLWYQFDSMLQAQAVWNNVPIISAGNMSPSKRYTSSGTIETGTRIGRGIRWETIEYSL